MIETAIAGLEQVGPQECGWFWGGTRVYERMGGLSPLARSTTCPGITHAPPLSQAGYSLPPDEGKVECAALLEAAMAQT